MKYFAAGCLMIALMLGSCGRITNAVDYFSQEPDGDPVRQVIRTGSTLGFAASVAMSSIGSSNPPAYVRVTQSVSSYPGSGLIFVDPPSGQSLPPGIAAGSRMCIAGFWTEDKTAILSVMFLSTTAKQGGIAVSNISTFPVTVQDSTILLTFASEDINAGTNDTALTLTLTQSEIDAELNRLTSRPSIDTTIFVDQDGWVIEIHDNGTSDNPFDNNYSIIGAGQHIGLGFAGESLTGGEILQIIVVKCRMQNTCMRNPTGGWGMVRKYGAANVSTGERSVFGTSVWNFHSNCDGRAQILAGTGTYTGFSGKTVKLHLQ